jgi:hypothetical protein
LEEKMPTKKSTRKVAKRSTAKKATAKKSAPAKRSAARKTTGSRKSAGGRKKKSPVAKLIERPKRTARKAMKIARVTADRTRDVGEKMVGAADLVKTAADAVEQLVTGKRRGRRPGRSGDSGKK